MARVTFGSRALLSALVVAGAAIPARAVDYSWDAAVNGTFSDPLRWNPLTGPPGAGDTATFGLAGTYEVDFTANASTDRLTFGGSNTVTFDMGSRTYASSIVASSPGLEIKDTAKLVLIDSVGAGRLEVYGTGSLGGAGVEINTSGGFGPTLYLHNNTTVTAPIVVDGAGAVMHHDLSFFSLGAGSALTVKNGADTFASNFQYTAGGESVVIDGAGSTLTTNANGARVVAWGPSTADIIGGGKWDTSGFQFEMGVLFGAGQVVNVGNGVNTSTVVADNVQFGTTFDAFRGFPEMRINSGGLVTATRNAGNSVFIYDRGTLTMNGGVLEVGESSNIAVADLNGDNLEEGLLRGNGTIRRISGAATFTLTNDGDIKPGDTSASPAIGTLTIEDGDFLQNSGGSLHLDLSHAGADAFNVLDASVDLAGNLIYQVVGSAPQPGDTFDLITALSINYHPDSDNLDAVLGPNGYSFYGVVTEGDYDILRLVVPEPASAALLAAGSLALLRRRC
jgi:hypothetical protein